MSEERITDPGDDLRRAKDQLGYYSGLTHLMFQVEQLARFGDIDHSWAGAENLYFLLEPPLINDGKVDGRVVLGIKSPSYFLALVRKQQRYSEIVKTLEIEIKRDFDRDIKKRAVQLFLQSAVQGFYYHKILHPYDSRVDIRNLGKASQRKPLTNLDSQVTQ